MLKCLNQSMLSAHNRIKLNINNTDISGKSQGLETKQLNQISNDLPSSKKKINKSKGKWNNFYWNKNEKERIAFLGCS